MNPREQFEKEYYSAFITSDPHYEYAFKKWLEYYYQTEVYDRRTCSGTSRETGNAIPTSTVECIDINRNAKRLMNLLAQYFHEKSIEKDTWILARNDASKYSHKVVQDLLIRLSK